MAGELVDFVAGTEIPKIGIKIEESVHFSTVIVCADSEVSYPDRPAQTAYSAVKAVVLVLATFVMQIILIYMIHKMTPHYWTKPYKNYCALKSEVGLNAAVCNSDSNGNLANVVAGTNEMFAWQPGEWFGMVAMTLYIGACCQEAHSIINFGGLLFLPRSPSACYLFPCEDEDETEEDGGGYQMQQMAPYATPPTPPIEANWFVEGFWEEAPDPAANLDKKKGPVAEDPRKGSLVNLSLWIKGVVFLIAALRTAVVIALLIVGLRFLATTDDLKDFVLNSLALVFVFEVDDLAFMVLVPLHQRNKVALMDQPAIDAQSLQDSTSTCNCLDQFIFTFFKLHIVYSDVFTFIAVIVFVYISLYRDLYKFQQAAKEGLCIMGCTDYTVPQYTCKFAEGFYGTAVDFDIYANVQSFCSLHAGA